MRHYLLGKQNKQLLAASYSLIVSVFNFLMSCWLIPNFGLEGALAAGLRPGMLVVLYFQNNFNNARVSIVTCTYKQAHLIGETIQSVLRQTFKILNTSLLTMVGR